MSSDGLRRGEDRRVPYLDWQHKLAASFFGPRTAPGPFVLFLDDDEAIRLWPDLSDPAGLLAASVADRLDWGCRSQLFGSLEVEASRWSTGDRAEPPPTLPLLGLTVMAASGMRHDQAGTAAAFYVRLAERLEPDRSAKYVQDLTQQLRQSFDPVADMWRQLDEWINSRGGEFGASTIRSHPSLTRIGYALSQALVNLSDRMRLTSFYAACGAGDRPLPSSVTLLRDLRMWAARPRGLSGSLTAALADSTLEAMLAEQIHRLADTWDGIIREPEGQHRIELCVALNLDPLQLRARWVLPVVDDIDADTLRMSDGSELTISRVPGSRLYACGPGQLPPVAVGLTQQLRGIGENCAVAAPTGDVLVFREDEAAGGWRSVGSLSPFEDHVVAVRGAANSAATPVLKAADLGWRLVPQGAASTFLPGWYVYTNVRFSAEDAFVRAVASLPPALAAGLLPDPGPRPKLAGGLPLRRELGPGMYLAGGEPGLLLPLANHTRDRVAASLDGTAQEPPFKATGFPIELSRLGPLELGRHEVVADGEVLVFRTHASSGAPGPPSRLGWDPQAGYAQQPSAGHGTAAVCGARVPAPATGAAEPGRALLPRTVPSWVIDRRGCVTRVEVPAPSPFFGELPLPPAYYFESVPDPASVWRVTARRNAALEAVLLHWVEPHVTALDSASAALWRQLGHAESLTGTLWRIYVKAASACTP